jgi:hypothetical protein
MTSSAGASARRWPRSVAGAGGDPGENGSSRACMLTVAWPRTGRCRRASTPPAVGTFLAADATPGPLPTSPVTTGCLPGGSGFRDRTPAYTAKGVGGV